MKTSPHVKDNNPVHLVLTVTATAVALIFGSLGFYQLDSEQGWTNCVYKAVQLFSMNSGAVEGNQTPFLLEVSRWLAPFAVAGAVYATAGKLLTQWWRDWRLSSFTDHAVVCGAGNRGSEIARVFAANGNRKVVVIELDEHNPTLGELRNLAETNGAEIHIIHGNALDEAVLAQARAHLARTVVAVTGADQKNLSICTEAEKLSKSAGRSVALSAGIESWAWRSYYLDRMCSGIRLDSYLSRAARNLTLELAKDAAKEPRFRSEGVRVLIEASPSVRQELVRAAALNFQISGDKRPVLELTAATKEEEAAFEDRFPAAGIAVDIRWHTKTASQVFPEGSERVPDFAVFALEDDIQTLEAAERCWMRSPMLNSRIQACIRSESSSIEMPAVVRKPGDFEIRNIFKLGLDSDDPTQIGVDALARLCHAVYFRSEKLKNPDYGNDARHHPEKWEDLPERTRESNRLLAMHHEVKSVAWQAEAGRIDWENNVSAAQIEPLTHLLTHLARCEHMRWMAEKVMDGWRYNPQRCNEKLKHHLLVSFDALQSNDKDKDYDAFLWAFDIPEPQLARLQLDAQLGAGKEASVREQRLFVEQLRSSNSPQA